MGFRNKMWKNIISLGLAFGMLITSAPMPLMQGDVAAAEEVQENKAAVTLQSIREEAKASYDSSDKKGFDLDLSEETFNGTGLDYSVDTESRHYMQVFGNLQNGEDDQTLMIRFKTDQNGFLFGIGAQIAGDGKSLVASINNGQLRLLFCNTPNPDAGVQINGLKGSFGRSLADGKWHTLALSFMPSYGFEQDVNMIVVIDGSANWVGGGYNYGTKWSPGFNQVHDTIDQFQIGCAQNDFTGDTGTATAAFNGEIEFLTVINKAYSVQELSDVTTQDLDFTAIADVMMAEMTCQRWMFTGGTEGVADFSVSRTTRNWVGLFEDSLRSDGSVSDSRAYVMQGRFVFNTSKKNADLAEILLEYDTRIAAYKTKTVGIMIGASDYQKGQSGLPEFLENLETFVEKLKQDHKFPLILTPYPSLDKNRQGNITLYSGKIMEKAAEWGIKAVDLSSIDTGFLNADGSLKPAGHQAVANKIKTDLGLTNKVTNYGLANFSDGSYTIAKKAESGEEAQLAEVIAGEDSITVTVKGASSGGTDVHLEYTLTDTKGAVLFGTAKADTFTVDGLKKGEPYTLMVYDTSRGTVRESYQPVGITVIEGAEGICQAYADGNVSVNEKIQSLLASEEPVTYLFMGDSITHGILTQGYDNVPQMFEKYLNEIGRDKDVVLNTGVCNATLATTLDQIEGRLTLYHPDVVMVMLGTNDTSSVMENTINGFGSTAKVGISGDEYAERYKTLVRKIYETNPDASIVLRVPCDMVGQLDRHSGFEEKFAKIYEVADTMRREIPGLDITVVNHLEEWRSYHDNVRNDNKDTSGYGWFLSDGIHPNGRGNLSMFQQIIKELGLYVNTSELANYQYNLDEWTDSSDITASVTRRASRANFDMCSLSGYANGLKTVTLTLTAEDGRKISKTEAYPDSEKEEAVTAITLDGLDVDETYTAEITGKDAVNSKEISFATTLAADEDLTATDTEREELVKSLAAAEGIDTSDYPQEILEEYQSRIADLKEQYIQNENLTVEQMDEALAAIRLIGINTERKLEEARKQALQALQSALETSEAVYYAKRSEYTKESFSNYERAYLEAQQADENTDTNTLRGLLESLKGAEEKLVKMQTGPSTEQPPADSGEGQPPADSGEGQPPADSGTGQPQPGSSSSVIEQGKVYVSGEYNYKVTSISKRTAELTGAVNKKLKKITVTDQIVLGGDAYKVTSIAASAFKGNKTITGVTIGSNVETIGKQAFSGCVKLKTAAIKSTKLAQIGAKAFYNCKKLKSITITSKVLKKAGNNTFKGTAANLVIKVPKAKYKAYTKLLSQKGQGKKAKIKK